MPAHDVQDAAGQLSDAIIACGVLPLLAGFGETAQIAATPAALLDCYASFAADTAGFGAPEQAIMRELGLAHILEAEWWASLVLASAAAEPSARVLGEAAVVHSKLRFLADALPNLLARRTSEVAEPGRSLLRVVLPEEAGARSHPLRLSSAIEAVCMLWTALCSLTEEAEPLSLLACAQDRSGVVVSFTGPSATVAEMKALLMQVWDGVVMLHNASLEHRAAVILATLAVMAQLGDSPVCLARRRAVEQGVRLFLEAGACTPEMHDPARFTPARLLDVSAALQADAMACVSLWSSND